MLSTSMTDGFSGFTTSFLESLRDEFPKSSVFTTGMIESSTKWKRPDTEVSLFPSSALSFGRRS